MLSILTSKLESFLKPVDFLVIEVTKNSLIAHYVSKLSSQCSSHTIDLQEDLSQSPPWQLPAVCDFFDNLPYPQEVEVNIILPDCFGITGVFTQTDLPAHSLSDEHLANWINTKYFIPTTSKFTTHLQRFPTGAVLLQGISTEYISQLELLIKEKHLAMGETVFSSTVLSRYNLDRMEGNSISIHIGEGTWTLLAIKDKTPLSVLSQFHFSDNTVNLKEEISHYIDILETQTQTHFSTITVFYSLTGADFGTNWHIKNITVSIIYAEKQGNSILAEIFAKGLSCQLK